MTPLKNVSENNVLLSDNSILTPGNIRDVPVGAYEIHALYHGWLEDQEDPTRWQNVTPVVGGDSGVGTELDPVASPALDAHKVDVAAHAALFGAKSDKAANLSDLANATTARGNLGLGTAATHAHTDYDLAGMAADAQAAAIAASDPSGAAAAAQAAAIAASQPHAANLDSLAAQANSAYGRGLLNLASGDALIALMRGRGTLALRPAANTVPNGYTYWASDDNGGTLYEASAGAWVQLTPGITTRSGLIVAGPTRYVNTAGSTDMFALGTAFADISAPVNLQLVVPASPNAPLRIKARYDLNINPGTATLGTLVSFYLQITDAANASIAEDVVSVVSTGVAGAQGHKAILEGYLPAGYAGATLKIRGRTSVAKPANWTSAVITPGHLDAPGPWYNDFYAETC